MTLMPLPMLRTSEFTMPTETTKVMGIMRMTMAARVTRTPGTQSLTGTGCGEAKS